MECSWHRKKYSHVSGESRNSGRMTAGCGCLGSLCVVPSGIRDGHRFWLSVSPSAPAAGNNDQPLLLQAADRHAEPAAIDAGHIFPAEAVADSKELLIRAG